MWWCEERLIRKQALPVAVRGSKTLHAYFPLQNVVTYYALTRSVYSLIIIILNPYFRSFSHFVIFVYIVIFVLL